MINTNQKFIRAVFAGALAVIMIIQIYPTTTAYAGIPFSPVDVVTDPVHTALTAGGWVAEAGRFIWDKILSVALQALKKRLLDTMTDQIVGWINGGGKPKFTTDFGSVFTDAADAAVGDVLQQYASTKALCQPFAFNIQLQLQKPAPLSQQVTCSLTSVISNFKAYRDNFENGGWLGYQELLKPQNNQWGAEIITQDEILNRTARKTSENVLRQQINVGFNSEECTGGWDVFDKRTRAPFKAANGELGYRHQPPDPDHSRAPNDPPPTPDPTNPNLEYVCAKATVTTPGGLLAEGLKKSTYKEFDLVINSTDLTNSLAIIADAAFNRLISAGVKGLKDIFNPANPPTTVPQDLRDADRSYRDTQSQITRDTYLSQLNPAKEAARSAQSTLTLASETNQTVIDTANELLTCNANPTDLTFAQNAISVANSTEQTIIKKSEEVESAITTLDNFISSVGRCADISCLSQINQQNMNKAISAATGLNIEANNLLLGAQNTLTEIQKRKMSNNCPVSNTP